jgi:type I restriction enzyme S subunit
MKSRTKPQLDAWPTRKLREIAEIRISNVDKKVYASEKPVKLCNYMDVYANEYVTDRIQFMEGSATPAEVERFSLNSGDVIITKDSETPDDIGIPAVVIEQITDLVCGYHLALIRPNAEQLDSIYLAKQLSTSRVARYFSLHASGSTRYGLPVSAIEAVEISTPPKPEQAKIAEILSTVDRAIEQTEALIAKQQRIKTGLMQDLLTRGIDEHGNLRSEQTHPFKDSPLGRIPVEWEVKKLEECVEFWDGKRVPLKQDDRDLMEGGIPYYGASGIIDYIDRFLFDDDLILVGEDGENVVSRHLPLAFKVSGKVWVNKHAHVLNPLSAVKIDFLTDRLEFYDYTLIVSGSAQPKLNQHNLRNMLLPIPKIEEQNQIAQTLIAVKSELGDLSKKLNKFRSLKTALMQDLLTGKKRVTTLLKVVSLAE